MTKIQGWFLAIILAVAFGSIGWRHVSDSVINVSVWGRPLDDRELVCPNCPLSMLDTENASAPE